MSAATHAALVAAETVRELARETVALDGYTDPCEVDRVLADLEAVAYALPQVLAQAARWVERANQAGRVAHDGGEPMTAVMPALLAALDSAGSWARTLGVAVQQARWQTAHLLDPGPATRAGCPVSAGDDVGRLPGLIAALKVAVVAADAVMDDECASRQGVAERLMSAVVAAVQAAEGSTR